MPTLTTAAQAFARGTSSRDLLEECPDRIVDPDGEGSRTFLKLRADVARAEAEFHDEMRRRNAAASHFAGIPVSIKDLFDLAGDTTTAGSIALRDGSPATRDAVGVARLRAAGFIPVGRTNMTEFAFSGLGVNPHYGTPLNRYDRKAARIPGGSSSGAAVSVTDAMALAAIGTDNPIDRTLALRDDAVSAARAKPFADAVRLFSEAYAVLVVEGQHPGLAVGMQVDLALAYWEMGHRAAALSSLADALDAVEVLDPAASRQNERAHQFARASVGLFLHRLNHYPSGPTRNIAIGQTSALSGDEALLGVDLKPLAHNWRILALCEIELGLDLGIQRRSLGKQGGPGLAPIEMFIAMARYSRSIINGSNLPETL